GEFQSADQARRLLHAQRLSRDSKPARQSHEFPVELARGPEQSAEALARRTLPADLWAGLNLVLDYIINICVHGLILLGDVPVCLCRSGRLCDVLYLHTEADSR